jgi:hypothetical protein
MAAEHDKGRAVLAATLGIGGELGGMLDGRAFMFVINSRSGRFLPMVSSDAIQQEVVFAEWMAGSLKLLGYDKLYGWRKEQQVYREDIQGRTVEGHYAVFW